MTLAMFRVMLLGLLRDRGSLAMSFLLPPMIYMIFASIFSGASGTDLALRIALLDEANTAVTQRLVRAIRDEPTLRPSRRAPTSVGDLERLLREDQADVGVVIRADPGTSSQTPSQAPIVVYGDAAKAMASAVVAGQLQRILGEKLPDATYRRTMADFERSMIAFTTEQRARADGILDNIVRSTMPDAPPALKEAVAKGASPPPVSQETIPTFSRARATVVYYAGAVAILFLMYSAMHGSMTLIDERTNGITDRILQGGRGRGALIAGKFLFLMAQGIVQVGLIFLLAAAVYGVEVADRLPQWFTITAAAAAATAGLGLALAASCRTRQQAQTISTFLVLVLAALGGSMVPRFLMPEWLQELSWGIPNTWVIEAYHGLLWRDAGWTDILPLIASMLCFAALTLVITWTLLRWTRQAR